MKDPDHPYYGWAGRIGTANDMDWKNAGISKRDDLAHWELLSERDVVNHHVEKLDCDYVILQGQDERFLYEERSEKSAEKYDPAGFDLETFSGAMEELLYTAATLYEGAKIGFIVTYTTPNSTGAA